MKKNKIFFLSIILMSIMMLSSCNGNNPSGVIQATDFDSENKSKPSTSYQSDIETVPNTPDSETAQTVPLINSLIAEKKSLKELSREKLDILSSLSNKLIQYGVGNETDNENRPTGATSMQEKYYDMSAVFIEKADEKKIYLTFDEGYEAGYTPDILKTLAEKNVKATFFITGGYLKYSEDMVKAIIDGGHTLGNHTENHPSLPECSVEQITEEINTLHNSIKEKFGIEMKVLRPPKGEFSEQSLKTAEELGYKSIFWSFAYADWDKNKQPEPAQSLENLKKKTHNGAIILLHAVSSTNAKILADAIDYWKENGYELATFN